MRDTTWLSFSVIQSNVTLKHPSTDGSHEQHNFVPNDLYYRFFIRNKARNKLLQGTSTEPKPSLAFFAQNMPIGSQMKMLYSMLIQGSLTNGTLEWINSYKYWNPTITSITVLFRPNQVMFDNVDSTTNIVTNTDDEKRMIPPGYYTIGVIIVLLNTITDTPISISTKASNYGCIWIQAPYSIHFTNAPDIREILGLEGYTVILPASFYGSNVIEITRNCQVIQVYSSLVRSSNLKIANRNNNLLTTMITDDPTTNYCRSVEDICIPMIHDSIDRCLCSRTWKVISCD